jgi:excisionase family DNA binding protein
MDSTRITENLNKEIFNFNEACTFLDYSKSYLYKLTHLRQIPHYKPNNKKLYFKRSDLEEWLLRNRVKTDVELQQQAEEILNKKNRGI